MPVQCYLNWTEFQEAKITETQKTFLLEQCRPKRCPYCGEWHVMRGHGFTSRYIIPADQSTVILLIPRYRCKYCQKTVRILPLEVHSHCNYLSQTIFSELDSRILLGRFVNQSKISKALRQHWYYLLQKRCQQSVSIGLLFNASVQLRTLPSCAILFRNQYEARRESELVFRRPPFHRILSLIVCLDTS